jgi:hypothetical protein
VPKFWDVTLDNNVAARDLSAWKPYGSTIESLPGEAAPYQTGSIGVVNGDGSDETLFSSDSLRVNSNLKPVAIASQSTAATNSPPANWQAPPPTTAQATLEPRWPGSRRVACALPW